MANDRYHIPGQVGESPLHDALRIADAAQYTPESQPAAFQFLKDIEHGRYTAREATLELSKNNKSGLSFGLKRRVSMDRLMKEESALGGEVFGKGKGYLFWLDHKNTGHTTDNQVGDWYFAEPMQQNNKQTFKTIHYITQPDGIEKRFDGATYAMSIKETQDFINAIYAYLERTRGLYPMDDMLYDLQTEMKEESLVHRTPEEQLADQAIIRQLYDNYRRQHHSENKKDDYDLAA